MVYHVFRLQISVDDLVGVHVVQRSANLLHQKSGHILWYFSLLFQEVVKLSRVAEFQCEIDIIFVSEEGVHLDDVGVVQKALDFDLSHQLHDQLAVHVRLVDLLQSTHETRCPMPALMITHLAR